MHIDISKTISKLKYLPKLIKKIPKWLLWILILLLITGIGYFIYNAIFKTDISNVVKQQFTKVTKGDISVTLSGSAPLAYTNKSSIKSKVSGKIKKVYFKEGDTVKTGALLLSIDDKDARNNIEKINDSIEQTKLTLNSTNNSINKLTITAPFSGDVTNIAVKTGNTIDKNTSILTITDTSKLRLKVSFNSRYLNKIFVGQKVNVNLKDFMQSVNGVVSYVGNNLYVSDEGGQVFNVEITVNNLGAIKEGMTASAEIVTKTDSLFSISTGTLDYINKEVIKSESGGIVKNFNLKENQHVKKGDVLLEASNDDLLTSKNTTNTKIKELYMELDSAMEQLDNYNILAPMDGTITSLSVQASDDVKTESALVTISDTKNLELSLALDELDISKVEVGQKASITIDALTETSTKPLSGVVSKIAIDGNSTNGVSTYPVIIKLLNSNKLKCGMNANAKIIVSDKKNVLRLPINAIQTSRNTTFVMLKNGNNNKKSDSNNKNMGNLERKTIKTGISNDSYVEILSGLKEGDEVILSTSTQTTSSTKSSTKTSNTSKSNSEGPGNSGGMPMGGPGGF